MADLHMTRGRAETYRIAAAELLTEANIRGDQDDPTIAWAVGFLLRRANSEPDRKSEGATPKCGHCGGSGLVQGRVVGQPVTCTICKGAGA
jgi:hypothetical protein